MKNSTQLFEQALQEPWEVKNVKFEQKDPVETSKLEPVPIKAN